MQDLQLRDTLHRGLGRAARHLGGWCQLFRPRGPTHILDPSNQIMRIPVAFLPASGRMQAAVGYGQVAWQCILDAAYTRPGDFLERAESAPGARDGGVWFIAAQPPLLPVLCVRTSAIIEIQRPLTAATAGIGAYGGAAPSRTSAILSGCPAAIVQAEGHGSDPTALPSDIVPGSWTVLLPNIGGLDLRPNDQIHDDRGRSAIVAASEMTDLGWRLVAREIMT